MPQKLGGTWAECLYTRIPLPNLPYAGKSMKLKKKPSSQVVVVALGMIEIISPFSYIVYTKFMSAKKALSAYAMFLKVKERKIRFNTSFSLSVTKQTMDTKDELR